MSDTPRILLAGIAKDEAAYLPEWCFHHIRLGVAGIIVYVNNTSDNTSVVLDKIGKNNPVSYKIVDGIEVSEDKDLMALIHPNYNRRTPLQAKSYADIYLNTSAEHYDYILYLDIDEYLLPETDLAALVSDKKHAYYFPWFSLTGDAEPFAPVVNNLKGEYDSFAKSMIKTGLSSIQFISPHTVTAQGVAFHVEKNSLVLHRVLRSVNEYKAMILRSTPSNTHRMANGFKLNRKGWTTRFTDVYEGPNTRLFSNYREDYTRFLQANELFDELNTARASVLKRSDSFENIIQELNYINSEIVKVLPGTDLKHISWLKLFMQLSKTWFTSLFLPSLAIKHLSPRNLIKEKLSFRKTKKFYD